MQISQVRVLDVRVLLLQVVPELHRDVCAVVTLWTVVHLDPLMFASM